MSVKPTLRLFFCWGILQALSWPAAAITCPQLALGGGYEVAVIVSNVSAAAWEGDAFLLTGAGAAWSTPRAPTRLPLYWLREPARSSF